MASNCSPTEANGELFLHTEINTWIYDEYCMGESWINPVDLPDSRSTGSFKLSGKSRGFLQPITGELWPLYSSPGGDPKHIKIYMFKQLFFICLMDEHP